MSLLDKLEKFKKPSEAIKEPESQEAITEPISEVPKEPKKAHKPIKPKEKAISKYDNLDPRTLLYFKDHIRYAQNTIHNKPKVKEYRNLIANNQEIPEELLEKAYVIMYIKGKKGLQYIREIEGIK